VNGRRLAFSVLITAAVYAVLIALHGVLAPPLARAAALASGVMLSRPGWEARATYGIERGQRGPVLNIVIIRRDLPEEAVRHIGVRDRLYMPLAMVAALTLASPVSWRRRAAALPIGLGLLALFFGFGVWITAVDSLGQWPGNAFGFARWSRRMVHFLYLYAVAVPATAVIAPLLCWGLATFRARDLPALAPPAPVGGDSAR
jgi:hypothetical protein